MAFLAKWGTEILFALVSTGIIGYFKYKAKEYKNKLDQYEKMNAAKQIDNTEHMIEDKLEPVYKELEDLRKYIRETKNIEQHHMNLIIASYKFRLIQLCREFIRQGYMTQEQYDQLTEFYKLYIGLGGNGQAKDYYERAIELPIHAHK